MPSRFVRVAFLVAVCAARPALAAGADDDAGAPSRLTADRFSVTVGAFSAHARTTVRLDAPGGVLGTTLGFERDLGVEGRAVSHDLTFAARFGNRHRLELEAFQLDRDGQRASSREFRFGEDVFEIGWELATFFHTDVVRLGYAYSFLRGERRELGVHAGLHVTDIRMGIRAALLPFRADSEEHADATAPLPVVGLQGAFALAPRWTLSGRAQIFRLRADDFDGELNHVAVAIEHDTFRRVGLGFAADFFEVDLASRDAGLLGAFKLQFSGPRVFVHAHF